MNLLLKTVHMIDPAQGMDCVGDILVKDGKIAKLGQNLEADGVKVVCGARAV